MRIWSFIAPIVVTVGMMAAGCTGQKQAAQPGLTVAAPEYLTGILDRAATQFEEENGIPVKIVYLPPDSIMMYGKNSLRVDVVIGSDPKQFAAFKKDTSLIYGRYSCPFALSMVLVGRADGPQANDLEGIKGEEFRRVVIVDPAAGYEGQLAETALRKKRVWNKIQNRLIPARSADQLISYLTTGEADAAVALESSLYGRTGLRVMCRLDDLFRDRLIQCGAVAAGSDNKASARAFLDLLELRLCPMYDIPGVNRTGD
jgi:molybdate transport system substrate-binding protein